eukprot:COSAG03_NODE_1070_length_4903_cov_77.920067_4_plen_126_part_00
MTQPTGLLAYWPTGLHELAYWVPVVWPLCAEREGGGGEWVAWFDSAPPRHCLEQILPVIGTSWLTAHCSGRVCCRWGSVSAHCRGGEWAGWGDESGSWGVLDRAVCCAYHCRSASAGRSSVAKLA